MSPIYAPFYTSILLGVVGKLVAIRVEFAHMLCTQLVSDSDADSHYESFLSPKPKVAPFFLSENRQTYLMSNNQPVILRANRRATPLRRITRA
jgi:hypothetical protein